MTVLRKQQPSFLNPLKCVAENRLEVSLRNEETRKCSAMSMSHGCNILDAKARLAARRAVGSQHICVECHSTHKSDVTGRESLSRVATETMKRPGNLARLGRTRRRREVVSKVVSLLSKRPPAEMPSCLEQIWGNDAVVVEDLYLTFRFQCLQNFYFEMPKL